MLLYFIRHAESESTIRDSPLTPIGIEQAIALNKRLVELKIDFHQLICSPLLRARQTVQYCSLLSECDEIKIEPLCREFQQDISDFLTLENDTKTESELQCRKRIQQFIEKRQSEKHESKQQNVAVVTHGDWIQMLFEPENSPFSYDYESEYWLDNADFVTLEI